MHSGRVGLLWKNTVSEIKRSDALKKRIAFFYFNNPGYYYYS